jgi:hypothetical protein
LLILKAILCATKCAALVALATKCGNFSDKVCRYIWEIRFVSYDKVCHNRVSFRLIIAGFCKLSLKAKDDAVLENNLEMLSLGGFE